MTSSLQKLYGPLKTLLSSHTAVMMSLIVLVGVSAILCFPVTYQNTENTKLDYKTIYKDEPALELNTMHVAKEGENGTLTMEVQHRQSLFNFLFGNEKGPRTVLASHITKNSSDKIVLHGTRKWQYMMCSDGTYRYFTNKQFMDKNTGFTSKSPDYCAKNHQGKKVRLADSISGNSTFIKPTYAPTGCKLIDIPYKTIFQNVSWLKVGEIQEVSGYNGFRFSCSNEARDIVSNPLDKIIYRGTGQDYTTTYTPTITTPTPDYAAKQKCDSDYSYAKAQLSIAGAAGGSAWSQIQDMYTDCLRKAGF